MENEAYTLAYHMAWVFFPCFLLIAMLQLILFCLFNHKYHPFVDLLDDADNQGTYLLVYDRNHLFGLGSNTETETGNWPKL